VLAEEATKTPSELLVDFIHAGITFELGQAEDTVLIRRRCPDCETIPGFALTVLTVGLILLDRFAY